MNSSFRKNGTNDFLKTVKLIKQFGSENIFNSDQNGFQLEIHSGRSLSNEGVRKECAKVECAIYIINNTYHTTNNIIQMIMEICCHLYLLY